jgi:hypothetical protein
VRLLFLQSLPQSEVGINKGTETHLHEMSHGRTVYTKLISEGKFYTILFDVMPNSKYFYSKATIN